MINRIEIVACAIALIGVVAIPKNASACSASGAIGAKWQQLQAELGPCIEGQVEKDDGAGGRIQQFQNGYVDWTSARPAEAYAVYGGIAEAWMAVYGGPAGTGQPVTDEEFAAALGPAKRQTFLKVGDTLPSYLEWNPGYTGNYFGSPVNLPPCQAAYQVCQVRGGIGWLWFNSSETGGGLPPINNEFSLAGGSRQDFVDMSSLGSDLDAITWDAATNDVCFFAETGYSFNFSDPNGGVADCLYPF